LHPSSWAHWLANQDMAQSGKPVSYGELVKRTGISSLQGYRCD
jgi:endonuclease G